MWMFTNRTVTAGNTDAAWTTRFTPYGTTLSLARVARSGGGWRLQDAAVDVADAVAGPALRKVFAADRPVLVYVHGNNNTPAALFERCERLERLYDVEVVGFSWPSEGRLFDGSGLAAVEALAPQSFTEGEIAGVTEQALLTQQPGIAGVKQRYHQAKVNAVQSVQAFERFANLLALARLSAARQPYTVAAHSLGAYLLQQSLGHTGAATALGAAQNIVLLAPCCASAGHRTWLQLLHPAGQVVVTVNQGDSVLLGARLADRNEAKLGSEPGPKLVEQWVRYAHVEGGGLDLIGHSYFAQNPMPDGLLRLFKRVFSSQRDLAPGESPRDVYPGGCDADGVSCWMANPPRPDLDGGPS